MNADLVSIVSSPSNRREATRETHHASREPPPGRLCLRGRPWLSRTHAEGAAIERPPPAARKARRHHGQGGSKVSDWRRPCHLRAELHSRNMPPARRPSTARAQALQAARNGIAHTPSAAAA